MAGKYKILGNNFGDRKLPVSIIRFNRERNGIYPTQKPVPLLEYLIKTYTRENDTVLDFTMGSGSTGIACINTGRRFIGIDHDKGAWDKANARIAKHVNEKL